MLQMTYSLNLPNLIIFYVIELIRRLSTLRNLKEDELSPIKVFNPSILFLDNSRINSLS